jgi:large subunit ribosomal protein L9
MSSQKVSVILLEDVPGLGEAGEIVSISEGYARNALFPNARAALATESVKQESEQRLRKEKEKEAQLLSAARAKAAQLDSTELTLSARIKDGDEIFGRITAANIAKELKDKAGLNIKAKDVLLPQPLTRLGGYDVTLQLTPDVEASIKVTLLPEPGSEPKKEDDE